MDHQAMASMMQSLGRLLSSGKFSDCVVVCDGAEYKLHKAIICPQSPFFDKAFSSGMKEEESSKIDLEEDNPGAVKSMVDFLYTLDYQPSPPREAQSRAERPGSGTELTNITHHARVYSLADKYDMSSLRQLAAEKFKRACELWWDTDEFTRAALEVYTTTPEEDRSLRGIVVTMVLSHTELIDKPDIAGVIHDTLLGHDIVIAAHKLRTVL